MALASLQWKDQSLANCSIDIRSLAFYTMKACDYISLVSLHEVSPLFSFIRQFYHYFVSFSQQVLLFGD